MLKKINQDSCNHYQNNDLEQKIETLTIKLNDLTTSNSELKQKLSWAYSEIRNQNEINDKDNKILQDILSRNDSLLNRTIILTKTKLDLKKNYELEINELKSQKLDLEHKIEDMGVQLSELSALKSQKLDLEHKIEDMSVQLKELSSTNNQENNFSFLNYMNESSDNDFRKAIILRKLIKKQYSSLTVAIKTPSPSTNRTWGDYFFSLSLKKSLEKKGFNVVIHELEFWDDDHEDIVIVLRGLTEYIPKPQHLNLMWNISHPDDISFEEYENYDIVFVASNKYANDLNNQLDVLVHPLLQCTDLDNFYPQKTNEFHEEILFVGITRGIFRKSIRDIVKTNHDFSVYGRGWEEFIDAKYIKGQFIDNNILNKAYSSCKILLNDHWEDMVNKDFVSNRIYDALACKTLVISDYVESIHDLFEGNVITYNTPEELNEKLDYYLTHENERINLANRGYEIVIKNHTFDNRVDEILQVIQRKYSSIFIKQIEANMNQNYSSENVGQFIPPNLSNGFNKEDYNKIINVNKVMTIKIARLQEKICSLEQEKLVLNKKKDSWIRNIFKSK